MATRFYLPSTGAAAISPTSSAGWEDTSINSFLRTVTTKISSTMTTVSFTDSDATNKDILFRTYVSDPIAAQVIASQTVGFQMRCAERALSCNMFLTWNIKVVSNDGSIVRGTITSMERDGTEAVVGTLTNRRETSTSTAVTAHSGDRIVIEVGMGGDPAAGSDHDSDISIGDDSGTDLPENDTETNAYNPWIEFPNSITFWTSGDIIVHQVTSVQVAASSATVSVTVPSGLSNTAILAWVGAYDSASPTDTVVNSVVFNTSESFTGLGSSQLSTEGDERLRFYLLLNPTATTANLVTTWAASVADGNVHVVVLSNVLQSSQPDDADGGVDDGTTTFSISTTPTQDRSMVFSGMSANNFGNNAPSSPQVQMGSTSSGYWVTSYTNPTTPAGSVTHNYTNGNTDDTTLVAVAIKVYVSSGTSVKELIGSGFIPFAR